MAKGSALRKPANDTSSDVFAALLDESLGGSTSFEGQVVKGTIVRIANDFVTIDVGLKSEGRVALREFSNGGTGAPEVKEGDIVDIFVDRMKNKEGEAVLRSEEHTSELQSLRHLVCRLLLEKEQARSDRGPSSCS